MVSTVSDILAQTSPFEQTEYVLFTDGVGRLMIYQLDSCGRIVSPPCFVEEKSKVQPGIVGLKPPAIAFGPGLNGFV